MVQQVFGNPFLVKMISYDKLHMDMTKHVGVLQQGWSKPNLLSVHDFHRKKSKINKIGKI